MKTHSRSTILTAVLALWLSAVTVLAAETATVPDLAGQWQGKSRFTGIRYEEATQNKVTPQDVEIALQISADGKVTGRMGGAELTNGVVVSNRGWLGRKLHLWSDFVIRGQIVGAVAAGSEGGLHPISVPFNFDGTQMSGTVFATYPVKYPYPFLSLRLNRAQQSQRATKPRHDSAGAMGANASPVCEPLLKFSPAALQSPRAPWRGLA